MEKKSIDTNGFPYVFGVPENFYFTTPKPETEFEIYVCLQEYSDTIADIQLQLKLNKLTNEKGQDWEISAMNEVRHLTLSIRLLKKLKSVFVGDRIKLIGESNQQKKIDNDLRLQVKDLSDKVDACNKRIDRANKHNHFLTLQLDTYRSFSKRLLLELYKYKILGNRESLTDFLSLHSELLPIYSYIVDENPEFGKMKNDLRVEEEEDD